jgi:hypothetical protein
MGSRETRFRLGNVRVPSCEGWKVYSCGSRDPRDLLYLSSLQSMSINR